jgi:hypothetical protein
MLSDAEKKAAMQATYYGPMWNAKDNESLSKEDKLNFG